MPGVRTRAPPVPPAHGRAADICSAMAIGMTRGKQSVEVVVEGMVGDARHRDSSGAAEGARRQRDAGVASQGVGVVVERLVEIAEAVEQDGVRVLRLQVEVLAARGDERFRVVLLGRSAAGGPGAGHGGEYTGVGFAWTRGLQQDSRRVVRTVYSADRSERRGGG